MAHFSFLLLCWGLCARAFCCKHIILPRACLSSLELLLSVKLSHNIINVRPKQKSEFGLVRPDAAVWVLTCCFLTLPSCRRWNLPGHLPGFHPHGLQRSGQAEPLPAVRSSETLIRPARGRRRVCAPPPPSLPRPPRARRASRWSFRAASAAAAHVAPASLCQSEPETQPRKQQCKWRRASVKRNPHVFVLPSRTSTH